MNRLKVKGQRKLCNANMSGKKKKKKTVLTESISGKAVFKQENQEKKWALLKD